MTETTRMQELIEIFCDADRLRGLSAEEIEQYWNAGIQSGVRAGNIPLAQGTRYLREVRQG